MFFIKDHNYALPSSSYQQGLRIKLLKEENEKLKIGKAKEVRKKRKALSQLQQLQSLLGKYKQTVGQKNDFYKINILNLSN